MKVIVTGGCGFIGSNICVYLKNLSFDDKYISRVLDVYGDNSEFIEFTPTIEKSIIVKSSLSCVDEGSSFQIIFENDEEINLTSWNDFNCEGDSFFDLANTMLSKMVKPIKKLMFQDGRSFESYTHEVSEEDKNFFIEIIDAINEKNFKTTDC